jgi:hypothetical protein
MRGRQLHLWADGPRNVAIVSHVKSKGLEGATRDELAKDGICPLQSACGVVLELIRSRVFIEQGYRPTRLGKPARVFIHRDSLPKKERKR